MNKMQNCCKNLSFAVSRTSLRRLRRRARGRRRWRRPPTRRRRPRAVALQIDIPLFICSRILQEKDVKSSSNIAPFHDRRKAEHQKTCFQNTFLLFFSVLVSFL